MIKRVVEIARQGARLSIRRDQLVIDTESADPHEVPCEDVGLLLVEHPATRITQHVLARLAELGAAVVICSRTHLPAAIVTPVGCHSEWTARQRVQLAAGKPLQKRLWQTIVREKIRRQAAGLDDGTPARKRLTAMTQEVRSGDPGNLEAQAARIYWTARFGTGFRRDPDGPWPNPILNYGYTVVRAAVARAVVSAGLNAAFGVHHSNRGNAFCLADDLVEPFRPRVDEAARGLTEAGETSVTPRCKKAMLGVLYETVQLDGDRGPFMVSLHRLAANLWRCYEGSEKTIRFPMWSEPWTITGTGTCGS